MMKLSVDEVIFQYLKASAHLLTPEMRERFASVDQNKTWREKCICRDLIGKLGLLDAMLQRNWYRVQLTRKQVRRVFLGYDPTTDDFSRHYSNGTYRVDITARNMMADTTPAGRRKVHRDAVLASVDHIDREDLA